MWRLSAECDEVEPYAASLTEFLGRVSADAVRYLVLGPLVAFWDEGGTLAPGELLSVYPPLITAGLERNASVVLGNTGSTDDVPALAVALDGPEPLRGSAEDRPGPTPSSGGIS